MTAVEREFRVGRSVVFGTLNLEYNDAYDVNITGGAKDIVLPKEQGWVMQPLPFEFPSKKNALIEYLGLDRTLVLIKSSGSTWTDTLNASRYGEQWFIGKHGRLRVIFEGED